jgi:hypothetical protein
MSTHTDITQLHAVRDLAGTTSSDAPAPRNRAASDTASLFDCVSAGVRLQMELVARTSASPATALPAIIGLIVEDNPRKRAAVISAIEHTPPLREQWERTWAVLRR